MLLQVLLLSVEAFHVSGPSHLRVQPAVRPIRMQTLIPDAPTVAPSTLPETWEVPDTFSFTAKVNDDPPLYRVTLFRSTGVDAEYVSQCLMKVTGMEVENARRIAEQAESMGFAQVGTWVQEVAEMYGEGLQTQKLVVDVSPES
eukprot:CAMPEP_0206160032 /NCGR_PEP_ID=MMETSP1474-20131121/6387_1 /ASSEMBLY_ACC=CAM_ASM_001110 /TAXON_ID=97495 /ORGANISM="Imantonia sp., Strain RCC918" /LENGTH=143 /DNA_ID=CAMNT_0053561115 /DNA_START=73 /DNA_END=504 /DNA_ORIENTATION=-